jgi:hypothetical protein
MDSPAPKASTSRKRVEAVEVPDLPCMEDGNFQTSYTWHSAGVYDGPMPTPSEDDIEGKKGSWILGIDEAGRGPVLGKLGFGCERHSAMADCIIIIGPQVYGCVACPAEASDQLKALGFAGE